MQWEFCPCLWMSHHVSDVSVCPTLPFTRKIMLKLDNYSCQILLSHTGLWSGSSFCWTLLCWMWSYQRIQKIMFFYAPSNFSAISPIPSLHLVTVQLYLHQPAIRTTSTEPCKSAVSLCSTHISPDAKISSSKATRSRGRMDVPFTLPLKKCPSHSTYSPLDTPSYRSPIKSTSQYFQICYWSQL